MAEACSGSTLDADIDVQLYRLDGASWTFVCGSATYDSSWELCDIPANNGETYRARFQRFVTNQPQTYLGIAWSNYSTTGE